jgi:preprotein translocase subunit SecG
METFIAVCLAVLVMELTVLIAVMIVTLLQVKKSAQAVEVLTYRVDQQVASFGEVVASGWMRILGTALNLASRYFGKSS